MLSNFHVCPACEAGFFFDGYRYGSVEHAFQASKIALAAPERAREFTRDSGSALGNGTGLDARNQRKCVHLGDKIKTWNRMSADVMERAQEARFSQCPHARAVLLDTGDAQLWHIQNRAPAVRFEGLERVRARLRRDEETARA